MNYKSRLKPKNPDRDFHPNERVFDTHRDIHSLFPGMEERNFLYYVCPDKIFVVSEGHQPIDVHNKWQIDSKPFNPITQAGLKVRFKTRVNSSYVIRVNGKRKEVGAVMRSLRKLKAENKPLDTWPDPSQIRNEAGYEWLAKRSDSCGFSVEKDQIGVTAQHWFNFTNKKEKKVVGEVLDMEGVLTVTSPELFQQTIIKGMGGLRGFGCGLLMLFPINSHATL